MSKDKILFSFCEEDADSVIPEGVTDEQRDECYNALEQIDCSPIFEQMEIIVSMVLRGET